MNEIEKALQERFLLQEEYLGNNKTVNKVLPLVSITVATYQHVNYIRDCLEGILMQKTTFPYEIILGEDGSVDGTQEICKEYAEKYPDKIRLFIRDRNLSQYRDNADHVIRFNGVWNRMSARGKYIALCEGDDYWTDPLKLQKQVDCLIHNLDIVLNFSNRIIKEESSGKMYVQKYRKKFYSSKDLLGGEIIGFQTICCKKECIINYSDVNGDIAIPYNASLHGKLYCLSDITAVYRMTGKGVATSRAAEKVLSISLQNIWDFHKAYDFPSKRLLIKAQTRYVFSDLMRKVNNGECSFFLTVKTFLQYYNKSFISVAYAFVLMNAYTLYFLISFIYEKFKR